MVERVNGKRVGGRGQRDGGADRSGWANDGDSEGEGGGPDYRRARELLWIAAHDLSVPLAAIQMQVRAKQRFKGALEEDDWRACLTRIEKVAGSALRMLDDLLTVERLQSQPAAQEAASIIDAENVLSEVIVTQAVMLERVGCSIFVKRQDDLERVVGRWSRASLERLFGNLIQNVVRHAPGAPIEVSFARRGEDLQIRFADGGPGLPPGVPSAAQSFSIAPSDGGHGLGLWIVSRTVAELGGAMTMQSRAGKGLAFEIRLPFGC